MRILKFIGRPTGFIVETADLDALKTPARFGGLLTTKTGLSASRFAEAGEITYRNLAGKRIRMKYQDGQGHAQVWIDGKAVEFGEWPVYDGPYVTQTDSVLTVNDGKEGFIIDCRGDLPVYKPWKAE